MNISLGDICRVFFGTLYKYLSIFKYGILNLFLEMTFACIESDMSPMNNARLCFCAFAIYCCVKNVGSGGAGTISNISSRTS